MQKAVMQEAVMQEAVMQEAVMEEAVMQEAVTPKLSATPRRSARAVDAPSSRVLRSRG